MKMGPVNAPGGRRPACDDPHALVCAQVTKLAGARAQLADHWSVNWSSLHFVGHRHRIDLLYGGEHPLRAAAKLFHRLPDHMFKLGDHFVADAAFTRIAPEDDAQGNEMWRIGIELLTVKE